VTAQSILKWTLVTVQLLQSEVVVLLLYTQEALDSNLHRNITFPDQGISVFLLSHYKQLLGHTSNQAATVFFHIIR
jgi:hypothetical protein